MKEGCVTEIVEEGSRKGRSSGTIDLICIEFSPANTFSSASNGTSSSASRTFLSKGQKGSRVGSLLPTGGRKTEGHFGVSVLDLGNLEAAPYPG